MSLWKTTMAWLGLGPDTDYDQIGEGGRGFADPALRGPERPLAEGRGSFESGARYETASASRVDASGSEFSAVRSLGPMSDEPDYGGAKVATDVTTMSNAGLRPLDAGTMARTDQPMGTVRAVPASARTKPQVVAPRSFNDAQEVADRFRGGSAVLLNLRECDGDLGRRLIDFCSGLCYGLRGQMERVGDRVFLVSPADVKLSAEDRQALRDTGLVN